MSCLKTVILDGQVVSKGMDNEWIVGDNRTETNVYISVKQRIRLKVIHKYKPFKIFKINILNREFITVMFYYFPIQELTDIK